MSIKKAYFDLSKSIIKDYQDKSHELFRKVCSTLNIVEEDKDIIFDYLFNNDITEKTQQTIDKYTESV